MKTIPLVSLFVGLVAACGVGEQVSERIVYVPVSSDGGSGGGPMHTEEPEKPKDPEPEKPKAPEKPKEPEQPKTGLETCATQTDAAKLKPLDMIIMLDRSGSMKEQGKWSAATAAINAFATSSDSAGIGVALSYFPESYSNVCVPCNVGCPICYNGCCALPTGQFCLKSSDCKKGGICSGFLCYAGGGNASCEVGDYSKAAVPLAPLPGVAAQLDASMMNTTPAGGTPTAPALKGALSYAASVANKSDGKDVVVVLATDGEPTECQPQGITDIANMAGAAAKATPSVPTFVIGVGTSVVNLNAIASAGGTKQAYLVDANAQATKSFLAALNTIRKVAVACQYEIPKVNGVIAYNLVNVTHGTDSKSMKPLTNVPNAAACGKGGWHYDDVAKPKSIVMCPETCALLQAASDTKVEIVYGCETIVK